MARLRTFVRDMTRLVEEAGGDEPAVLERGTALVAALVAADDWLPEPFARPDPEGYRQYLLHCDPFERFSVVSFVWGPGQGTPVHDHTVWGIIGMLRGAETCRSFEPGAPGAALVAGREMRLSPGEVTAVSPAVGDIHRVANALSDRASISIHAYGANIGAVRRHVYDPDTGAAKPFVSGYSNTLVPNLWQRPAEAGGES